MKTITTIEELMSELESGKYNYYGLRNATGHDLELIKSGREYLDCSFDFIDGTKTENQLNGTCAIGIDEFMSERDIIKSYEHTRAYYSGKTIILVGDRYAARGEDDCEIIIGGNGYGANVIAFVNL